MITEVVIGAAYGDEGKGRMVCDLATHKSVVVRFNGGAQAGHGVFWEGQHHVFSHFGSGTPKGASTVLSKHFVCHPMEFLKEFNELDRLEWRPRVLADPRCQVTTIYDVFINLMAERSRGKNRHGSVGQGFGETIERAENYWGLTVGDIARNGNLALKDRLRAIRDNWLPLRCQALGFDWKDPAIGGKFYEAITSEVTVERFAQDCRAFVDRIAVGQYAYDSEHIIFEGAQGLMLDMEHGAMPHCTRSYCGLKNVRDLTSRELQVWYMSRAYTTRHGAGPLSHELDCQPYAGIVDKTNVWNESQAGIRYSYLNLDTLEYAIGADRGKYGDDNMWFSGCMTCCDQLSDEVKAIVGGGVLELSREDLAELFNGLPIDNMDTRWSAESVPREKVWQDFTTANKRSF